MRVLDTDVKPIYITDLEILINVSKKINSFIPKGDRLNKNCLPKISSEITYI